MLHAGFMLYKCVCNDMLERNLSLVGFSTCPLAIILLSQYTFPVLSSTDLLDNCWFSKVLLYDAKASFVVGGTSNLPLDTVPSSDGETTVSMTSASFGGLYNFQARMTHTMPIALYRITAMYRDTASPFLS